MVGTADHYGLNVSDIDAALEFYRDVLELSVERRFEMSDEQNEIIGFDGEVGGELVFLDAEGFTIELIAYDRPSGENAAASARNYDVGVGHFCFEVENVDREYERLSDDVDFINPPVTVPSGARIAYLYDPDGNVVELLEKS